MPARDPGATPTSLDTHAAQPTPIDLGDAIVQAKLRVGPANDVDEREADALADRVVRSLSNSSEPARQDTPIGGQRAQRAPIARRADVAGRSPSGRVQRAGFTYAGQSEVRGSISNQQQLRDSIDDLLDSTFVGVRALFTAGGVVTSVAGWGELLFGMLAEDNDMADLSPTDCAEIVENIKAENRKEQFLQISEFYGYFDDSYETSIWTLDAFKDELKFHHVNVDEHGKDDATLEALLAARGDREKLQEDPARSFQFGSAKQELDMQGLKSKLDDVLGGAVNWGHEITDCLDDSGKKGEMYYYQSGAGLTQVGNSTQSHASSKGGRTIIWETSGDTTEILAIGKHTTRADNRLSKGASYEIVKTFGPGYSGYEGKIIGFKA